MPCSSNVCQKLAYVRQPIFNESERNTLLSDIAESFCPFLSTSEIKVLELNRKIQIFFFFFKLSNILYEKLEKMSVENTSFALSHKRVIGFQLHLVYTEFQTALALEIVLVLYLSMRAYTVI